MTERKTQRKAIFVTATLDATGIFTAPMYVGFQPDELRIKQVAFSGNAALPIGGCYTLFCDALCNGPLGSFIDPCVTFTSITYALDQPISGTFSFRIMTTGNTAATTLNGGSINIIIEFRKTY